MWIKVHCPSDLKFVAFLALLCWSDSDLVISLNKIYWTDPSFISLMFSSLADCHKTHIFKLFNINMHCKDETGQFLVISWTYCGKANTLQPKTFGSQKGTPTIFHSPTRQRYEKNLSFGEMASGVVCWLENLMRSLLSENLCMWQNRVVKVKVTTGLSPQSWIDWSILNLLCKPPLLNALVLWAAYTANFNSENFNVSSLVCFSSLVLLEDTNGWFDFT